MKRLLALSILMIGFASAFSIAPALANEDDSKRTVNPGEDPNEAKNSKTFEADVAAPGVCPECIARMKHMRLGADTTYRPAGNQGGDAGPTSTKEGTR